MSLRERLIEFGMNRTLPSAQNFQNDKWASLEDVGVSNLIPRHVENVHGHKFVADINNEKSHGKVMEMLHETFHIILQWGALIPRQRCIGVWWASLLSRCKSIPSTKSVCHSVSQTLVNKVRESTIGCRVKQNSVRRGKVNNFGWNFCLQIWLLCERS